MDAPIFMNVEGIDRYLGGNKVNKCIICGDLRKRRLWDMPQMPILSRRNKVGRFKRY